MTPLKKYQLLNGDITKTSSKYLAHQINCKTTYSKGLAHTLFHTFPHADVYSDGTVRVPGRIIVRGDGKDRRFVVNMAAQVFPGMPGNGYDTADMRLEWFRKCLGEIGQIEDLESIAFPYKIGCGLAGGQWDAYESAINEFAGSTKAKVYLYKL